MCVCICVFKGAVCARVEFIWLKASSSTLLPCDIIICIGTAGRTSDARVTATGKYKKKKKTYRINERENNDNGRATQCTYDIISIIYYVHGYGDLYDRMGYKRAAATIAN